MKEERVLDVKDGKMISGSVVENEAHMSSIFFTKLLTKWVGRREEVDWGNLAR